MNFGSKDLQILKDHHRFLRNEDEDKKLNYKNPSEKDYGEILAKKYYDQLYKEYAIADLSRFEAGQIGLRWQTKQEVLQGKGVSFCGNKICIVSESLESYEINFEYKEKDELKNALVKVRVCLACAQKLNYKKQHAIVNQVSDGNYQISNLSQSNSDYEHSMKETKEKKEKKVKGDKKKKKEKKEKKNNFKKKNRKEYNKNTEETESDKKAQIQKRIQKTN